MFIDLHQQSWQNYQMFRFLLFLAIFVTPNLAYALENDLSKAVILSYHRIDEPEHIESSLSFEQFAAHIKEIQSGEYNVLPLNDIIPALKNNQELPPKTIAITFEGGYRSINAKALPLLIENNIPFTIFIASNATKIPTHLDWRALKGITKYNGASFGILPADHKHITQLDKPEITRLINKSRIDFKENMGFESKLFAYPFGEISSTLQNIIKTQGFEAAFGTHSGPAHSQSNMSALPRFTMTDQYADLDRFRMITNTLPLSVKEIEPQDWQIRESLTQIGFTLSNNLNSKSLSCHISGQAKPVIETIENRIEIIPKEPIIDRTRLNCTLPAHQGDQKQWRWLGMLFH